MTAPRVSVFMASYNGKAYLAEAVQSVLKQTLTDFELVIVDDGSDAETLDILRGFASRDIRLRLIEGHHRGQIGTLNHAIKNCRAPLLARLDHEDRMRPERLSRQVAYMDAHSDVVAIGSATYKINANGETHAIDRAKVNRYGHRPDKCPPQIVFLMGPTLMVRADVMRRIGGYRPQFRAAEDRDISWRLAAEGKTVHLPELLTDHRDHAESLGLRERRTQAFGHLVSDLSAIAAHFGRDDSAILDALQPGGDYPAAVEQYTQLLKDSYPAETLVLMFYAKDRFRGLDGVPELTEIKRRIRQYIFSKPYDPNRLQLLPRLLRF
jgi:glycosyltransferase involved in cell wall biosynthesis